MLVPCLGHEFSRYIMVKLPILRLADTLWLRYHTADLCRYGFDESLLGKNLRRHLLRNNFPLPL